MLPIAMWVLALGFYIESLALATFGVIIFGAGYGMGIAVSTIYMNEIADPIMVGVGSGLQWVFSSLTMRLTPVLIDKMEAYWLPVVWVVPSLVMFVLIRPLIIETKGKTLLQIKEELGRYKYRFFRV